MVLIFQNEDLLSSDEMSSLIQHKTFKNVLPFLYQMTEAEMLKLLLEFLDLLLEEL